MPAFEARKIMTRVPIYIIICLAAVIISVQLAAADSTNQTIAHTSYIEPLDATTLKELRALYKQLIDAENRHDLAAVRPLLWNSPSTLFVAKTATPAEGNWAGFWGTDVVYATFLATSIKGHFRLIQIIPRKRLLGSPPMSPKLMRRSKLRLPMLARRRCPKPFLMILDWIKTPAGWKMATDIPLPIPPTPPQPK